MDQGTIQFVQYQKPALQSGDYTILVQQQVSGSASYNPIATTLFPAATADATKSFAVTGERFVLNPGEVYAQFPPQNSRGEFDNVLPHAVLQRKTLPWERSSGLIKVGTEEVYTPWLALLVVMESELPPTIQSITLQDLKSETMATQAPDTFFPPAVLNPTGKEEALEYGENWSDSCLVIDMEVSLFNQIAPSGEELTYLCHTRAVTTHNKEDSTDQEIDYSVVVSNRIAGQGEKVSVYLVSLEEYGPYLPQNDGTASAALTKEGKSKIRLVVLNNWNYFTLSEKETFEEYLESLNLSPSTLQLPLAKASATNQAVVNQMNNGFQMGYTMAPHFLRNGEKALSWYRGPMIPYQAPLTLQTPLACSDAAVHFNPQTGLIDASYAAAWELGQLLALQNKSYSVALFQWRHQTKASSTISQTNQTTKTLLAGSSGTPLPAQAQEIMGLPSNLSEWLGGLSLLKGVPFEYLVPNDGMLPQESLRFFYLDENWIDALLDGALSIGRVTQGDLATQAEKQSTVKKSVHVASKKLRPNIKASKNKKDADATTTNTTSDDPAELEIEEAVDDQLIKTGFLLRSQVVQGWPGLEINGFGAYSTLADPQPTLPILRMERLASDLLLCIFLGEVKQVDIHEPAETLHFGVDLPDTDENLPNYTKLTKSLGGTGNPSEGGYFSPGRRVDPLPFRSSQTMVLQVISMADQLYKLATDQGTNPKLARESFTSAEFALEMVEGVQMVSFRLQSGS